MLIRNLLFLFVFCIMTGCAKHHEANKTYSVSKIANNVAETRLLPPFDKVYIDAPVNVNVRTNMRTSNVSLTGNSRDLPLIYTSVQNHILYVTLGRKEGHLSKKKIQYGPIELNINMPTIHGLTYRGKGRVVGRMNTDYMDIWIKNPGKTLLEGEINLHQLTVIGPGYTQIHGVKGDNLIVNLYKNPRVELTGMAALTTLDIKGDAIFSYYWMRGRKLIIRAREGSSKIQLAGIVGKLDVELWGHTRFNGRYIRARETFVKTHQHAIADISTTAHQHTLAMDASDIYFHNLPSYMTNFMGKNGAVLDMRDWSLLLGQEYTPYNK
jgi:hypothetical protein